MTYEKGLLPIFLDHYVGLIYDPLKNFVNYLLDHRVSLNICPYMPTNAT